MTVRRSSTGQKPAIVVGHIQQPNPFAVDTAGLRLGGASEIDRGRTPIFFAIPSARSFKHFRLRGGASVGLMC
jgi:hypothetical protein